MRAYLISSHILNKRKLTDFDIHGLVRMNGRSKEYIIIPKYIKKEIFYYNFRELSQLPRKKILHTFHKKVLTDLEH